MLGIGVTTYNRAERLRDNISQILGMTSVDFKLVIADDGSGDATASFLKSSQHATITGKNRGVAWNKNRCLFYLHEIQNCDPIILLEDDCSPTHFSWELPWIEAAKRHGHANIAGNWFAHLFEPGGLGTPEDPFICSQSSAQCSVFSAKALETVGYMDTRFGRYGFEHADHTKRLLRAGYGGIKGLDGAHDHNYLIAADGLFVDCLDAPIDRAALEQNAAIYVSLENESSIYRFAWRTEAERSILEGEMPGLPHASSAQIKSAFNRSLCR